MNSLQLPLTETEYRNALLDAAELGAQKALEQAGILKPYFKLREAQRRFGSLIGSRFVAAAAAQATCTAIMHACALQHISRSLQRRSEVCEKLALRKKFAGICSAATLLY